MEIGNEIGQKIRSAIKAKLVELGAYVDDELPDYIMVMVANKKTEAQMADDLNLFLSGNTHKFTAWLHVLLEKLQSITSDSNAVAHLPPVVMKAVENEKLIPSLAVEMSHDVTRIEKAVILSPTLTVAPPSVLPEPELANQFSVDLPKESEHVDDSVMSGIKLSAEHSKNIYEFDEESFEVDSLLDDSVAASTVTVEVAAPVRSAAPKQKETRKVSVTTLEPRKRQVGARTDDEEDIVPQKAKVARINAHMRLGTSTKELTKSLVVKPRATQSHGVMSSVGAVLRHNFDDDEDDYNPSRPSIGNVASVVRVSERKSSVPPTLQANKSLLLKAMKQAEQSVARARQQSETSEPQLTDKQRQSALSRLGLQSSSARQAKKRDIKKERASAATKLSKRSPRKVSVISSAKKPSVSDSVDDDSMSSHSTSSRMEDVGVKTSRVVEKCSTEVVKATTEPMHHETNSDEISDEEELMQEGSLADKQDSRKFVVTLQGVNGSLMEDMEDMGEDEARQASLLNRNVVRVKPQTQFIQQVGEVAVKKSRPMERCKFWPTCKNAEACPFHHPVIPCRTFPACRFGDSCLYVHPMCKFDASCANTRCPYMHSTPRLPASASAPVPVIVRPIRVPVYIPTPPVYSKQRYAAPVQIKCKFFPKCTDVNCPFQHPKPCHYGANCANRNTCAFTHPDWPDKKLMKWTAPSARHAAP